MLRALLLMAVMLHAPPAAAQSSDATVAGRVSAEAGTAVPGAAISLVGESGIIEATTDPAGRFAVPAAPGRYDIRVAAAGYCEARRENVTVAPRTRVHVEIVLAVSCDGRTASDPDITVRALDAGTSFHLGDAALRDLPLDRDDPSAALLALAPGIARGSAFGAAVDIGTPRRLDGLDLSDPLDGRPFTTFVLPAATGATIRAGVSADERDGSGAVFDIVTRAGGRSLRGLIDLAGSGRSWSRDALPEATLAANPRLADRDRAGRSLRVSTVLSGPLTARVGFGLAAELADETRAATPGTVTRTPRVHGRLVWGSGARSANVVGFVDRRATSGDVPFALRPFAAPGLENERTAHTVAARTTWQGPLRGGLHVSASVDVLHGARTSRPTSDTAARQDDVTGSLTGSLGLIQQDRRTRTVAGGAIDWRTPRMGGHDLRAGAELERTQVAEQGSFAGGEFFHDLAGRPDTVDVWAGDDRRTRLGREAVFVTDTWTPGRRLAIVAGLRAARLHGGAYVTTAIQPRAGATVALDRGGRFVARAAAGVVADPLLATHVDRSVGGQTPIVTFQILRDGRRLEIARTVPTIAGVSDGIRHPQVREFTAGVDVRVSNALQVGGTVFARRFQDAIDTLYPEARWLALARPGLDGRALSIYRWLNRRSGQGPTIANVDGFTYLGRDNQPIGVASAGRDYTGLMAHAAVTLPRDRGSFVVAITSARSRGSLDDSHDAGIGRSDRFASPTAALNAGEGPATSTPDLAITVFGTTRLPVLPMRVSAIYQRQSGRRYAAQRTFAAATLDVPLAVDGRTALLEPRGARTLEPTDELSLRLAAPLPIGTRRPLELYADICNVLGRHTVTAVEAGSPVGLSTGVPLVFASPTDVQRPFRVIAAARLSF